ncbi:P27 family phage terminase small subunit [Methylicorpusculum oleiharenae]|uniref:P27 family phage terminase small subunit n=1 Tax=Methylicorpusculum oleiharenae TaxID=1338687 RepID=UPI00135967CF|nr:P27 family phage terminase small subunit [Methylicorpusculum oleiharenae]MCD2449305.1 P27 family phage terminase small subunit [Methylicorpusculum oleiharenae]
MTTSKKTPYQSFSDDDALTSERIKPDWLTGDASKIWDKWAPGCVASGRLNGDYAELFGELCELRPRLLKFRQQLDTEGWTFKTEGGRNGDLLKPHPLAQLHNEAHRQFVTLSNKFGLSPRGAAGIKQIEQYDAEDAAFEAL